MITLELLLPLTYSPRSAFFTFMSSSESSTSARDDDGHCEVVSVTATPRDVFSVFSGGGNSFAALTDTTSSEQSKIRAAKQLAKRMISLRDGKDYIDESLPDLQAYLRNTSVSLTARAYVGVAIVRMLAHGWSWEPENYSATLQFAAEVLHNGQSPSSAIAPSLVMLKEMFSAENDSDSEQEGKTADAVLHEIGKAFITSSSTGDGTSAQEVDVALDYLTNLVSPLLSRSEEGISTAAASLLSILPQRKTKRARSSEPPGYESPFAKTVSSLEAALAKQNVNAQEVAGILRSIVKVLTEAAFEAINDVMEDDQEELCKVMPVIDRLYVAVNKVVDVMGKSGRVYCDPTTKDSERCPDKHFDQGTACLVLLLSILSSPPPGGKVIDLNPEQRARLCAGWNAHRFHVGSEFEMIEQAFAHVVRVHNIDVVSAAASGTPPGAAGTMNPVWVCCSDPLTRQGEAK